MQKMKKQSNKNRQVRKKPTKKTTLIKDGADKLIDIYKDSGEKVDMTKLDRKLTKNKNKLILVIILILFILAGATLAGFLFFNKDFTATPERAKVELIINSVDEIASGEEIEIEIIYENKEDTAIKEGEITVHYPNGFYYKQASPQPDSSDNVWNIADVAAGAGGKITITGQIVGELEEDKQFTSFLNYTPVNFNSTFQDTANKNIKINDTIVTLQTSVPQVAFSGQQIEYEVKFKNTSSLPLPNAKIILDYPDTFAVDTAEPSADINNNTWKYDIFDSQEEKTIKIKGVISGESNESKEFKFKLGLEEPNGIFNQQVEKTNLILIVNPELKLTLEAPEKISLGQEIEYKLTAENISDVAITDLELKLKLSDGVTEEQSFDLEKIQIIKAGEKKELFQKTTIKNKIKSGVPSLKGTVNIVSAQVEGKNFEFEEKAETESFIKSELQFSSQARYYDNDLKRIGSGPIPPKVGETTSYVINWELTAQTGDLTDIVVTTSLANYIDGVDTTKKIIYDKSSNQVSWEIDELAQSESKTGSFTVFVTPTINELDKLLVLTKETIINAIDTNTNVNISLSLDKITSDLPDDPAASGQGVVEK